MELVKKAAYIKGLVEGLKLDENSDEGKVLKAMSELLEELAGQVEDVTAAFNDAVDTIDEINCDLTDLEDAVYGNEDDDIDDGDELYECVCPSCGDTIRLNEKLLAQGEITCPGCGEVLEFDFDESEFEEEDTQG